MRRMKLTFAVLALAVFCLAGCFPDEYMDDTQSGIQKPDPEPDPEPEPEPEPEPDPDPDPDPTPDPGLSYDDLDAYGALKSYVNRAVSPDFKLGAGVTVPAYLQKGKEYDLAVTNFDEMTAGNAMKYSSVVRWDGSMDFTQVKNFINMAESAGMTVYGHTLAWHSQQQNEYLRGLIKGKKVELPTSDGEVVLLEADFDKGENPFGGWGNNSTREIVNGTLKITNPSAVRNWEAQFAHDFPEPFALGGVYRMSFKIKGSAAGRLSSGFQITDGYKSAGEFPDVQFTTDWKDVEMTCDCTAEGGTRLIFSFGEFAGDIYIDDFRFVLTGASYTYEEMTAEEKKEVLTDAMDRWIKGMMEVTATKVSAWDAVNESVSGADRDGDGFYELESAQWGSDNNFYWQDYLGSEDYVRIVIGKARKYYEEFGGTAPLRLFINDYNLESDWDDNKKLKSLIHWIGVWESDGVTVVDGIGTQMHVSCYENPDIQASKEKHYVRMLQLMANTGKLVKISELDMGYVDKNGNTVPTSQMQEYQHKAMADYYDFIVSKYFEIIPPAQQYGITQWCMQDAPGALGTGWRGGEPVGLWDISYNRKYAYAGFANGLAR
ncbi:MAG: endo-1,4-beta-xylanase [Bacteroidales bacterium]|nr:endo-1,4-beta-xylanase [Bacteroidales bacterium]